MSTKYTIIGSIFAVIASLAFHYTLNTYGIILIILAVASFLYALNLHKKELKKFLSSQPTTGYTAKIYGTGNDTNLVIKSIGATENRFVNFNDIVNETNLSLKIINNVLDWLVINNLVTVNEGYRSKVYELTFEGKNAFKSIINPTNKN